MTANLILQINIAVLICCAYESFEVHNTTISSLIYNYISYKH